MLELVEPRAGTNPKCRQPVLCNVDMRLLLDCIGEARNVVIHIAGAYAKRRLLVDHVPLQLEGGGRFTDEVRAARETRALRAAVHADFDGVERKLIVTIDDIPRVSA